MSNNPSTVVDIQIEKVMNEIIPFSDKKQHSFRRSNDFNKIYVYPQSIETLVSRDVSFNQLLKTKGTGTEGSAPINNLLDMIPAVQIREYIMESRLKQMLNFFTAFIKGFEDSDGVKIDKKRLGEWIKEKGGLSELRDSMKQKLVELINEETTNQGFQGNLITNVENLSNESQNYVFKIPFFLYYCILTAKNTGFYEVPYNGNLVDESNGKVGWEGNDMYFGVNGGSQSGLIGQLMGYLGGSLRFNIQPQWRPGGDNPFPEIQLQFNLFNDNAEAAANNYVFVSNLLAKNRYLQYHIMQQNPAVYDIKINGFNRFFMCKASAKVESKGVKRQPSTTVVKNIIKKMNIEYQNIIGGGGKAVENAALKAIIKALRQIGGGGKVMENAVTNAIANHMFCIPDVYSVTFSFQSLIPNSLNNYLFQFVTNTNIDLQNDTNSADIGNKFPGEMADLTHKALKDARVISE